VVSCGAHAAVRMPSLEYGIPRHDDKHICMHSTAARAPQHVDHNWGDQVGMQPASLP
jgi:hypothetical protein